MADTKKEVGKEVITDVLSNKAEFIGQIQQLRIEHDKILLGHRPEKLKLIDQILLIKETADKGKISLTMGEIASAYGHSKVWLRKVFATAREAEKRTDYINGRIYLTGESQGRTPKDKIREAHQILIADKKMVTEKTLVEASGQDITDVRSYLADFIGSVDKQASKVADNFQRYLDFRVKDFDGNKKPEDMKVKEVTMVSKLQELLSNNAIGHRLETILKQALKLSAIDVDRAIVEGKETPEVVTDTVIN